MTPNLPTVVLVRENCPRHSGASRYRSVLPLAVLFLYPPCTLPSKTCAALLGFCEVVSYLNLEDDLMYHPGRMRRTRTVAEKCSRL